MLQVRDMNTFYGLSHVLFGVSLDVKPGEIACLLGRNGAGKTTLVRSVMGLVPPSSGSVYFMEKDITGKKPYEIARCGVGYAPSEKRLFGSLTVKQNLEIAMKSPTIPDAEPWTWHRVCQTFPELQSKEREMAGRLSGGEQQMLAVARTMMGNPQLLLLDEPSMGLAPVAIKALGESILRLKNEGLSILLAEQNMELARKLSDTFYIMSTGEIRFEGKWDELSKNEQLVKEYLAV